MSISIVNHRTNIENLSDDPKMPNIEDLSDDPMIAMMIIALRIGRSSIDQSESRILEGLVLPKITSLILKTSLMIQWSRWWSLHCGLGGPASPATIRRPLQAGSKYIIASATMSCHHPHCQRHCDIVIIIATRPKPSYGRQRQGLTGGIHGPGYSSSGYILGRSAQIGILRAVPSDPLEEHDFLCLMVVPARGEWEFLFAL